MGRRRSSQQRPDQQRPLRVFQANVGKDSASHDCALALADRSGYDIVMLQEPWTSTKNSRCTTKNHTAFRTLSPISAWEGNHTRPRVMTYVSLRSKLNADQLKTDQPNSDQPNADQLKPTPSRDILLIRAGSISFLNIYRQPGTLETLNFLDSWTVPSRCLIAGDFNASHTLWQAGPHRNQGTRIATWIDDNDLAVLNQPHQPTNRYGNILDLAISNIPTAQARVEDHLATSSDHHTLSITLPITRPTPPQPSRSRIKISDPKDLARLAEVVSLGRDFLTTTATTAEELDIAAAQLLDLLQDAIRIVGRCPQQNGRSAPWWTKACAKAHAQYQAAKRRDPEERGPAQLAKDDFRKVVRNAKIDFWRDIINNATTNADIFRIAGWVRIQSAFQPPPLQVGDEVFETQIDKANARKATLERLDAGNDIEDPWAPLIDTPSLPFSTLVSAEEAEDVTTKTGNTSPGADNITTAVIRACWPVIGDYIRWLYEKCLCLGQHPKAFKGAEVIMIPKPGKRDLSSPRSWRPISLLSCLGKGLERLIARRLAFIAIDRKVLHKNQAGALIKRSAVDLIAALIHDIEAALAKGLVATLVTMDIQGAFDTVLRNRLLWHLRQQGWPELLVRWVASFMTDRTARVHFQDAVTASSALECGLPQGSPVSPILFLLYTEPIYKIRINALPCPGFDPITTIRYGYADDIASLHIGKTLRDTTDEAEVNMEEIEYWGFSNEEALRWLGVWLDKKLSFKIHIEQWAIKAQATANLLRGIANTARGPPSDKVRLAVKACVLPVLFYGAEAWYPGMTAPSLQAGRSQAGRPEVSTRVGYLPEYLKKVLHTSIRSILPTWKTTPVAALYRESGIPPVDQLLEAIRLRHAARLQSLDPRHPLTARTVIPTPRPGQKPVYKTRLQRTALLLPPSPRPDLLQRNYSPVQLHIQPKDIAVPAFLAWVETLAAIDLIVYSEGPDPPEEPRATGPVEVFDAEVAGALAGLRHATSLVPEPGAQIYVCLDNTSAAAGLLGQPSESSQAQFLEFQSIARAHGATAVRWCPGHKGIPGNEQADKQAKACGRRKSPDHPFYCRKVDRRQDFGEFVTMIEAVHFFQEICPHHR
ncbi:hypothetical protein G7Z17_g13581 [Cylindrodendrum hubeiense]|uniref:Reverse transcriptase domain-containing protein n=1 Tax=Cylindrodendrum hubeiense TaxID=595255 RepID=A0A9P5L9F2_9HYPO|nr:hypothetical protein G7Z17_g13581 [Cylindrodendrum hubeiense]